MAELMAMTGGDRPRLAVLYPERGTRASAFARCVVEVNCVDARAAVMAFPILHLITLAGAAAAPVTARPLHRVSVDVRGPIAIVQVERSLDGADESASEERTFDVALPQGASAPEWEILLSGTRLPLVRTAEARARADHRAALTARGATPTRIALDEGTDFRVHLAGVSRGQRALVRYRFAAPLACQQGRFVLRMPGSLEPDPVPAAVDVSVAGGRLADLVVAGSPARAGADLGRARAAGRAPARAAWETSFALRPEHRGAPGQLLAAIARRGSETTLSLGICRAETGVDRETAPARVIFVVDRSRSVGGAGVVAERDLARALLEALPPSVRFNGVFFDRVAAPLFPLARAATTEALGALDGQLGPGQLANGTDLARALRAAADLARADADGGTVKTWLVLISDGALPDQTGRAEALLTATSGLPAASVRASVLLVRPRGDDPVPPAALALLGALPARFGGVLRVVDPADLRVAAAEVVSSLQRGGDLMAVSVPRAANGGGPAVVLAPGQGLVRSLPIGAGGGPLSLTARRGGDTVRAPLRPISIEPRWIGSDEAAGKSWRAGTRRIAAWVEPGPRPASPTDEPLARGQMDRQVVRNALSLAYLPRARACYLGRKVRTAADFELRGRLRLELHLERGEMQDAVVRSSTLRRPDIESCLRDAAFGIEVPRALHRDAPVIAALNLQFQPRTTARVADAGALGREIDLLIGPVSFPSDPRELLDDLRPPAPP